MRYARMDQFEARGYGDDVAQIPSLLAAHAAGELDSSPAGLEGFRSRFIGDSSFEGDAAAGLLMLEVSGPGDRLSGEEARTVLRRVLRAEMLSAKAEGRSFSAAPVEFEGE